MIRLDGDPTDFSHNPRGRSTRPNDFFSYFITEKDSQENWIVTGRIEDVEKIRPFVLKHVSSLPSLQGGITVLVRFKPGVNIRDVKNLVVRDDLPDGPHGAVGPDRQVGFA